MTPADQFFALADDTRCKVVEMLSARPMPVHELTAAFSISRPAISRHLRVLKQARLVKEIKRGRENIYSLQRHNLQPLQGWLDRQGVDTTPAPAAKPKKSASVVTKPKRVAGAVSKIAAARASEEKPRPQPKLPGAAAHLQLDLF